LYKVVLQTLHLSSNVEYKPCLPFCQQEIRVFPAFSSENTVPIRPFAERILGDYRKRVRPDEANFIAVPFIGPPMMGENSGENENFLKNFLKKQIITTIGHRQLCRMCEFVFIFGGDAACRKGNPDSTRPMPAVLGWSPDL
jgi:hypothetical protein